MKYKLVLIDFDATLSDFEKAQETTLRQLFNEFHLPYESEVIESYKRINDNYWRLFEIGAVSKKELEIFRFRDFIEERNFTGLDPALLNEYFLKVLPENKTLFDQAEYVCREISKKADIIIATNGNEEAQMRAIEKTSLGSFINHVAVSETAGFPKPDIRFFEYALSLVDFCEKEKVIIIGDSLSADIAGGINFGIDTCWFNPNNLPCPEDIKPNYIVNSLIQVLEIF